MAAHRSIEETAPSGRTGHARNEPQRSVRVDGVQRARELERQRLAREIHDDFCQRLAVVTIDLRAIAATLPHDEAERLEQVIDACARIGMDLQALSHEMYASRTDMPSVGLRIAELCRELGRRHDIAIDLAYEDLSYELAGDARLALYRIVQEALNNVVKHSRATRVSVRLAGDTRTLSLTVTDNGVGFDVSEQPATGVGLRSMQERARLLGGACEIRSGVPLRGTRISVSVPIGGLAGKGDVG